MLARATNRVHGLGLTAEEFWASTPREIAAHQKAADGARNFMLQMHASLQATLHNAHWPPSRGQEPWNSEMFLPGYQEKKRSQPDQSWRTAQAAIYGQMRKMTPIEKQVLEANANEFTERQSRAAALQASGAPREQVIAVMEGRA